MLRPVLAKKFVTLLIPAALGWSFLCGGGCFNPHVEDGKLGCAAEGKECPDGFACGPGRLCFKVGTAGSGGVGATGGAGGGAQGTGGNPGTGGAAVVRLVGQTCLIKNDGQPDQSDTCAAGLLCMNDCATSRCYKKCQSDADCLNSSCTRSNPDNSQRLCDVPYTTCNPQDSATGGCDVGFGCWLLGAEPTASGGDKTVCDCSYAVAGKSQPCSVTRDCFKGLVCPPIGSGLGAGFCQQVCSPTIGCQSGGSCRPFGARWGYCF